MEKKIFILDDDEDLLELTSLILRKEKHRVIAFSETDNIIEEVKKVNPDLILMDLWMPGLNGDDAYKLLQKDDKTRSIPVILVSAHPQLKQIADSLQIEYLNKPFDVKALRQKVYEVSKSA